MKDLHTHTIFSDGNNTPEEMVLAAIELEMDTIGISDHSYTAHDTRWCMQKEKIEEYKAEITRLKEKYGDRIEVLCGIEQDYFGTYPTDDYDYSIGSVHYVKKGDAYIPIDESPEMLEEAVAKYYDGDVYALVEDYFATVADIVNKTNCDIIGHFDLITKFHECHPLFDTENERYKAAEEAAVKALVKTGRPFEINTGAIYRGFRSEPYPLLRVQLLVIQQGGKLIMSSDSHCYESLGYGFEMWETHRSAM